MSVSTVQHTDEAIVPSQGSEGQCRQRDSAKFIQEPMDEGVSQRDIDDARSLQTCARMNETSVTKRLSLPRATLNTNLVGEVQSGAAVSD